MYFKCMMQKSDELKIYKNEKKNKNECTYITLAKFPL